MSTTETINQLRQLAIERQDQSLASVTRLLSDLNDRVISQVAQASGTETFNANYYPRFKMMLDGWITEFAQDYGVVLEQGQKFVYDVGIRLADEPMQDAGYFTSIPQIGETVLTVASQFRADKIANLTNDMRRLIVTQIQGAITGTLTPQEVISQLGRTLSDPGAFGSIYTRAKTITITEIKNVQNQAALERVRQWGDVIPDMKKTWLHSGNAGQYARAAHIALNHVTIGVNEKFNVNGYPADGPHDPSLPAGEVVNCGCDLAAVPPAARAAETRGVYHARHAGV